MSALFTNPKASFPDVLGSSNEAAAFRELHLLRSVPPLTNPFAADVSCPSPTADTLLGFFPSRVFSHHASKPRTRPNRKGSNSCHCARRHMTRDPKDLRDPERPLRPPKPGRTLQKCRNTQENPVGGCQPLYEADPDHLSVASSPPVTFEAASKPAALGLRSLVVRGKRLSSRRRRLLF
jgi:hypothetical protein